MDENFKYICGALVGGVGMYCTLKASSAPSTSKKQKQDKHLLLYTNPLCPFAHRAWMTAVEKDLSFETKLIPLSGELKRFQAAGATSGQWEGKTVEEVVAIKENYKANIKPAGDVPCLVVDGQIIGEADVVSEYFSDAFPDSGNSLFPEDPVVRSKIRHMLKILSNSLGVSAYYGLLMNQDPSKDEEYKNKIYKGLAQFVELSTGDGPFLLGEFSFFDVMFAPFYFRFNLTLKHYRGVEFIPSDTDQYPWAKKMQAWAKAIEARPSYVATTPSPEMVVKGYAGYAADRGVSKME